jgi:protein ImuB
VLWACLLLPRLALDAVQRKRPTDADARASDQPLALIAGPAQKRVLLDANAPARAAGLHPGQALLAAQALLPDVATVAHDPREDAALRRLLAAWAYRYSSLVCLQDGDALLLEVEGSLGLFGPWPRLEAMLREDLRALGISHRIAMAPTPLGACVLAACEDGMALADTLQLQRMLGRAPIAKARIDPAHVQAMAAMGTAPVAPAVRAAARGPGAPLRQRPARPPRPAAR